jgi:hypothetical protein
MEALWIQRRNNCKMKSTEEGDGDTIEGESTVAVKIARANGFAENRNEAPAFPSHSLKQREENALRV